MLVFPVSLWLSVLCCAAASNLQAWLHPCWSFLRDPNLTCPSMLCCALLCRWPCKPQQRSSPAPYPPAQAAVSSVLRFPSPVADPRVGFYPAAPPSQGLLLCSGFKARRAYVTPCTACTLAAGTAQRLTRPAQQQQKRQRRGGVRWRGWALRGCGRVPHGAGSMQE